MSSKESKKRANTLAALLKEKPKRGRPPREVSRQNVYIALSDEQKENMKRLASCLPEGLSRADLPDLAITILAARLEALHRAVPDRNREIPEGITDLESLYLLWDVSLPPQNSDPRWTSIRVSPQQAIEFGRVQGTLNAVFGANRSQTFQLGLVLLTQFLENSTLKTTTLSLDDLRKRIASIYL